MELKLPAAKVQQGDLTLFSTAIKVKSLIQDNFYSVETLDPSGGNASGYQRLLNKARARKLADYIVNGQNHQDAFLPTSVFLATDKTFEFDSDTNTILINTGMIGPFSVVDGQHRLEGLRIAAKKDNRVLEFSVPVNIAVGLPKLHQMCHFYIVNTTQKSVDQAVGQQIMARLSGAVDVENLPSLPKWISRIVEGGEVKKAVELVEFLNNDANSPWCGKIKMANDPPSNKINQGSFVKMIVRYVLTANNPLAALNDFDKEKRLFLNYWKAVAELLDDGNASVLYKYNSVYLFCQFSIALFTKLQDNKKFTVDVIKEMLSACFENIDGEYAGVRHSHFWTPGGKASGLNATAIHRVAQEMHTALLKSSMGEIEL